MVQPYRQQPTVTAGLYSANDAVGGLLTFTLGQNPDGGRNSGWISGVRVIDDAKQGIDLELVLFNDTVTPTGDNAAYDPSDADLLLSLGSILLDTHRAFADNGVTQDSGVMHPFFTENGNIYGQLVARGAPTYAATDDLVVEIMVMFDR